MRIRALQFAFLLLILAALSAQADPLARPGDMLLRHDIKLLVDAGIIDLPVGTWPIPWNDIFTQLNRAPAVRPSPEVDGAMVSLRDRARRELEKDRFSWTAQPRTQG
jgi:hypothetical protein